MKKKILITGAGGFIGSRLFKHLKDKNYDVTGVDFDILNNTNDLIDCNLLNENQNENILKNVNADFIFHLAAFAGPPRNEKQPEFAHKYNVDLTKIILKNIKKDVVIFFPTTDKIFEGVAHPNETTILNPMSVHGKLKLQCENLIKNHSKKHFIFRQPVVHASGGHLQSTKMSGTGSFLDHAIDQIRNEKKVEIYTNVKRCFLKLDELVKIYENIIDSDKYGTYNLASPMKSYYERLEQICIENKINFKNFIIKKTGNINPQEQDIDSKKFFNTFNFKFS